MSVPRFDLIKSNARRQIIVIRSVLIFAFLITLWLIFYPRIVDAHSLNWLEELVAGMTAFILYLLGNPITLNENIISSPAFSMEVGSECTGIIPMLLLVCGAIAYPSPILKKLVCIGLGIPVIFLLNLIRTVSLYYIGTHLPQYFDIVHFVIWQSITILAVIGLWLIWIRKVVNV